MWYIDVHSVERITKADNFEILFWRPNVVFNFFLSSVVPMALIVAGILYTLFKKTYGLKQSVKSRYTIIFSAEILLIFIYQCFEVYYTGKNWPYWCLIILPRTIYVTSIMLLFYTFISACKPNMIYDNYPHFKEQRIVSLFTLIIMGILPILLIINGPYLQILYLAAMIVAFGASYCYKGTFLHDSILHYTIYIVMAYRLYYISGHKLDFLNPKITRTFVGFPEFNLIITFSISIFDFIAIIVFFLALLPIASVNLDNDRTAVNPDSPQNTSEVKDTNSIEINIETKNPIKNIKTIEQMDEGKVEDYEAVMNVGRNYAIIMLFIDIIQDWFTRYLVFNFELHFFDVSHVDFTFRFVNWAVYFVIALNCFLIGKA